MSVNTLEVKFFQQVAPKLKNIRLPKAWGCVAGEDPPVAIVASSNPPGSVIHSP